MLLFKNQWGLYPTAIIHYNTSNRSFLHMAEVYRQMGVVNYLFHLILLNPELEHVDPHDPDLSVEMRTKVWMECLYNPWYFFREVLRIPPRSGAIPNQFRANRGNLALIWLFFNHVDVSLTQPRQTGKTTGAHCINLYLLVIRCENTMINLLTKDDTLRAESVKDIKNMRLYLPKYLRADSKSDSDNTVLVNCTQHKNIYRTAVAQNSEGAALNMGRGLTSSIKHVDESPFIHYIDIALPALLGSGNAARDEAKANGTPYGNIFTTTAGKKDTRSGRYMYDMIHGGMVWSERLFDSESELELHRTVRANSPGLKALVNCVFSHRQLGYTDAWLMEKMSETNSKGEDADRDYFNIWTSGGLSSPIAVELMERMRQSEREPNHHSVSKDRYMLRWYIPADQIAAYMANNHTVLGMDTSEAIGNDSITMVLVDDKTLDVIAVGSVNETNIIRFGDYIADFMVMYANVTLIPERKSTGIALIDILLIRLPALGIDPFKRIYNLVVDNSTQYAEEYRTIQYDIGRRPNHFYDRNKKLFGYNTSGSGQHSRDALYLIALQRAATLACDKCYDKPLIDEITGLVMKNGRIDHTAGNHDDLVIAWLLVVWFLTQSKNLQYYGHRDVLSKTREYNADVPPHTVETCVLDEYDAYVQQRTKLEIESLLDELKLTTDDTVSRMLELRIHTLDNRLKEKYNDIMSVDTLIADALHTRNKTMRERMRVRSTTTQSTYQRRLRDSTY